MNDVHARPVEPCPSYGTPCEYVAVANASAALIDAARLEGIRLGLEAAVRDVWHTGWHSRPSLVETAEAIRLLDPATIAREAVLDKLASEAQEQGMGYEKEADQ